MLTPPRDLFCRIERIVTENPKLLDMHHFHTLPDGSEAMTPDEIMKPTTAHCLAGWVIALTPEAPKFERLREDVDEFAQQILVRGGWAPLPLAIISGEHEDAMKVIRGRAAEERQFL